MRLKLETPLFVMEALLEAAAQLLANELATAEEEARAVALVCISGAQAVSACMLNTDAVAA